MNKLKKCKVCKTYTLQENHCNQPTKDAGYKFVRGKYTSVKPKSE